MRLKSLDLRKAFTYFESGPVLLVSSHDARHEQNNLMAISWSMVNDFTPRIAITTGPWNHSFASLIQSKECVLAVPPVSLLKTVVGIGTCSGEEVDKWQRFKLTPQAAQEVKAPLIQECLGCLECKLVKYLKAYDILVWQGVKMWYNPRLPQGKTVHANGDGTFFADGKFYNFRKAMHHLLRPSQYRF
ncbi:MAG: flavin reductase family protein [Bacteriovoracaceae bacterium]|nr:flavin reductase family protein [Bacteriovoracaceae bacterium]